MMKKIKWLVFFILLSKLSPAQWVQVADLEEFPPPGGDFNIGEIIFMSYQIGYYIHTWTSIHERYYYIGKTDDGWNSGYTIYSEGDVCFINDLTFINENIGYKVSCPYSPYFNVYKTVDGGDTWTQVPNNISTYLVSLISYPSEDLGYYLDLLGFMNPKYFRIIVSDSGNCTVNESATEKYYFPSEIKFINDSTGYIFCQDTLGNYVCIRSNDSAQSWSNILNTQSNKMLSLQFPTQQTGYISAQNGFAYKSTDAGITWEQLSTGTTKNLNDVYFINESEGYIVGDSGLMISTIDGGQNWNIEESGTDLDIRKFYFNENGQGLYATELLIFKSSYAGTNNFNIIKKGDNFELYPNPASESIQINVKKPQQSISISVFSILGEKIIRNTENVNPIKLKISNLPPGIYIVQIINGSEVLSGRFIKK